MRFIGFIIMSLLNFNLWCQTKVEIEKRVKTDEVPTKALEDLNEHLRNPPKVKWFYQEDGDKKVYEAKFKRDDNKYSVEFNTQGEIYNIEVIIKIKDIDNKVLTKIKSELKQSFEDYKIRKIQREYLGDDDDLFEIISEQEIDDDLAIRYEIEVNAKIDNKRQLYEMLHDTKGKLISQRKVKLKSTDILDY